MNLRRLLKRDSQRQLQLVETLYYSQHPRSSEELSSIIQCTIPAFLNDIRAINNQSEYYKIVRENSLYHLELKDNATIDILYSALIRNSIAFKLLEAIFYEESYTLLELSKKLFCSLSTVQASMKDLQETLGRWKMSIQRRPFRLTGDETAIRHLYFLYFSEKKEARENTRFSSEFFHFGEKIVRSIVRENELSLSLAQYNRLSITFFISLVRISRGHRIVPKRLRSTAISAPNPYTVNRFEPYLRRELGILCSEDIVKDSFWLLYSDLFLLGDKQKKKVMENNYSLAYHYEIHLELAEKLSRMLIVPLTAKQKDQVATILINQHLFHAKTKEMISILQDRKKDCLRLLETFHAHCVYQLRKLILEFTEEYHLFNSDEFIDNYIYQIIATVPNCLNGMRRSEKPVKLLVVSTDSIMQESLLTELLRLSLRGNYTIHQINASQLHNRSYSELFEEHDIVISTSTFDVPNCQTPIIAVELCPSVHSLNKIQIMVDEINKTNNQLLRT